jgi:hypothetical protein
MKHYLSTSSQYTAKSSVLHSSLLNSNYFCAGNSFPPFLFPSEIGHSAACPYFHVQPHRPDGNSNCSDKVRSTKANNAQARTLSLKGRCCSLVWTSHSCSSIFLSTICRREAAAYLVTLQSVALYAECIIYGLFLTAVKRICKRNGKASGFGPIEGVHEWHCSSRR